MKIVNQKQKMLYPMESNARETIILLRKRISTENVEKNVEEVRRKNQTYSFFQVINLGD